MKLTAGTKLRSATSTVEAIVIRPPTGDGELSCGDAAMVPAGAVGATTAEAPTGETLIGKRYVDNEAGLELLCTKGGAGTLSFAGRELNLKEAKPLPSSD